MRRLMVVVGVAAWCVSSLAATGQSPDGATIYKDHCARCHDQPSGRTPALDSLKAQSPETMLAALTTGSMAFQAQMLSPAEKRAVAEFLAGKAIRAVGADGTAGALCAVRPGPLPDPASMPGWNGWGSDLANTRFQPAPGLTAADVPKLTLKWAFGFPGGAQAYGHPTIVAGRVFVGSDTGRVYSLDATSGCAYWSFAADAGVRTAVSIGPTTSARGSRYAAYFGDQHANVYAVDADTGELIWKKRVDDHRFARITGAPALHSGRLYVPVSSVEEAAGGQKTYPCCSFRGSVVALDGASGSEVWKTYTIPESPQEVGKTEAGVSVMRPAGAAVWSSPTLDIARGVLYIGTGNGYTEPAAKTSDSVMAMDMKTGRILWWNQITPSDAFVIGCRPDNVNCPKQVGPDYDFGNSPILRTLDDGKRIIVIGQKSGMVFGLDPDHEGKVLWQFRAGKGSALGGIEWGSAADERTAYIPVSDVLSAPNEAGGLFALKLATGERLWHTPAPRLECTTGRGCSAAQSAPISVVPGVVFSGSIDGHMRAYSTVDGTIIWDFNTATEFETVNHVPAKGGSIDSAGPAIADGLLVTNSGYALWKGMPGNVLLAFGKAAGADTDVWDTVQHGHADNNGVKIHYATIGNGPLVVMIHGFPDFWYSWRHQMAALSDSYQVVAIDQRGYNLSDKPKGKENYDMSLLIDDVRAVVRHFQQDRAIIVGHDWGGRVAWGFALKYPEMTSRLIVCNLPHPRGVAYERAHNPEQQKNMAYARRFQEPDAAKSLTAEGLANRIKDPKVKARYIEAFRRSDFEAMLDYYKQNYPYPPYVEDTSPVVKVKPPVLLFHGLNDTALMSGALNNTWNWLEKDLTLVTVPGAGHWVQEDAADFVSRMMKSWLALQNR